MRPRFLLLDEPAAGLDEKESNALLRRLAPIPEKRGLGILIVDHDMRLIMRLCHRLHVLNYGRTIGEYVRRLRIERAARELSHGGSPIAAIGLRAGFFDQSHFSRVFRDHTGLTPAAFRAAARSHSRTSPQLAS